MGSNSSSPSLPVLYLESTITCEDLICKTGSQKGAGFGLRVGRKEPLEDTNDVMNDLIGFVS